MKALTRVYEVGANAYLARSNGTPSSISMPRVERIAGLCASGPEGLVIVRDAERAEVPRACPSRARLAGESQIE